RALPAPTNRQAVIARAGVDGTGVGVAAERAEHGDSTIAAGPRGSVAAEPVVEAHRDGGGVGGKVLCRCQCHDVVPNAEEAGTVVADELLRPQERVRPQAGGEPGLSPGWEHVVGAGEVVPQA